VTIVAFVVDYVRVEDRIVLRNHTGVGPEIEVLVEKILGCAFTVHRALGPGFLETIYQKALCLELEAQGLPFEREKPLVVMYRGRGIPGQRVDLLVGGEVIVEVKAVGALEPVHVAQVLSYLKTTSLRVGLLINFREALLRNGIRRVVL